jgi:hypothetical protein
VRVQVERVPARTRPPKVLWLWWAGSGEFDLDLAWRAYIRRFDLEHTVRFAKQILGWTIPRLARLSRPTAGSGWCWPATPSCAWPAPSPATSGCRGNGPDRSHGCHRCGCGAGFRGCCAHWARQRVRRNSPGAPQAGPGAAARDLPCVTQRSRSQPRDPGAGRPGPQGPPEGPSPILHARRPRSTVSPASLG